MRDSERFLLLLQQNLKIHKKHETIYNYRTTDTTTTMCKSRQQPALPEAGCCLAKRAHYVEVKEKSLHDIKQGAKYVTSD